MADANNTKYTAEPEERIEAALVAILAAHCTVAVEGALTPSDEGTARTIDDDSIVSVVVDQQSQDLDFRGPRVPHTYRAQVSIRYLMADSRFDGITDFSHIHASGGVNLSNCEFANRVECRDGYLGGGVTLANAKFGGVVTCENLYVGGTVRLNSVSASRNIEVSGCVLLKEPDTSGITKSGDANIKLENNRISSFPINAAK